MTTLRVVLLSGFAALLALTLVVSHGDAQANSVKQVVPGVWFREGDIDKEGHCNNVIIELSDSLLVVDANFPGGARRVMEDARKVSKKPVKMVFDTHHHGDHFYGNPVWTRMGAVTIAHQGVADEIKRVEPERWRVNIPRRKDVAELKLSEPEPPQKTFTESPYVINDPLRRVEFHFFGWAHTRGDGLVYLPKERVLATGDVVINGPHNFTGDANIANWPKVIRKVQKLDAVHILPGHGPLGGREMMDGQIRFFAELQQAIASARKSGKKLEDLVTIRNGSARATSVVLSPAVKTWVGPGFPAQVRDAYREVDEHKPAADLSR
ncbi:MAG: MBL fold metallo-hydrolase [Acidobacteria bacterium]|nr:MBL fold metallo-hydrolase [Acidobacteriota bacterium]